MPSADIQGALSPPLGVIPDFKNPEDVSYTISLVTHILCLGIVSPIVLLRIYARWGIQKIMHREDFDRYGGGHHQWEVTQDDMEKFLIVSYAGLLVYGPTAFLIKSSLLLIYTRLFNPWPHTVFAIKIFMLLMFLFYLPMQFVKIMICDPISSFWSSSSPSCFDQHSIYLADTIVSVITDFAVLIIPMPLMWLLHLPLRKKLRVFALLGAGGVAVAASVARLVMLLQIGGSADRTVTVVDINLLGAAETSIGLICASLPALNILFTRYSTKSRSKGRARAMDVEIGRVRKGSKRSQIMGKDESVLRWTYNEVEDGSASISRGTRAESPGKEGAFIIGLAM